MTMTREYHRVSWLFFPLRLHPHLTPIILGWCGTVHQYYWIFFLIRTDGYWHINQVHITPTSYSHSTGLMWHRTTVHQHLDLFFNKSWWTLAHQPNTYYTLMISLGWCGSAHQIFNLSSSFFFNKGIYVTLL
jgi:hypothetical protein